MGKRSKLLIILALCAVLALTASFLLPRAIKPEATRVAMTSGDAEAVMTTQVGVLDGIWDPRRYSDELYYPLGLAISDTGLIVADSMCDRIVVLDGDKNIRIGRPGQYGLSYYDSGALIDGYREDALFRKPSDVAVAANGDVIICDTGNNVIRSMNEERVLTIAGTGQSGYSNGKEGEVRFDAPRSVAIGADGDIYVADTMNHCIRRIDTDGNVTLFAGTPEQRGYADGAVTQAQFHEPSGLAISATGEIYVADSGNHSIRKIANGVVSTVAGAPGELNRVSGYPEGGYADGFNADARFNFPRAIALTEDGKIFVADSMNHIIRLIDGETTRTLAGNGTADRFYFSAENLKLTRPEGLATDGETLYISDSVNNRVIALPLTERIMRGRPSREVMLETTGITINSKYAYNSDIRIFIGSERVDMGRVHPWNTHEQIYIPIRPLFETLGATVHLDDETAVLTISIGGQDTVLNLDKDYFILKGIAVTTTEEITRLFPYIFEWFPEFSLIALHVPEDLQW
ncbi:MAG: stalk domain-containing protein [Oscillospiraceae bacterium]|nr:stalk domain-containing protein [Oscillospiraceae bacterium]